MKQVNVYPIGTEVLVDGRIKGTITRISLTTKEHIPYYEIEWFDGNTHISRWLYDMQFTTERSHKVIGFTCNKLSRKV